MELELEILSNICWHTGSPILLLCIRVVFCNYKLMSPWYAIVKRTVHLSKQAFQSCIYFHRAANSWASIVPFLNWKFIVWWKTHLKIVILLHILITKIKFKLWNLFEEMVNSQLEHLKFINILPSIPSIRFSKVIATEICLYIGTLC